MSRCFCLSNFISEFIRKLSIQLSQLVKSIIELGICSKIQSLSKDLRVYSAIERKGLQNRVYYAVTQKTVQLRNSSNHLAKRCLTESDFI